MPSATTESSFLPACPSPERVRTPEMPKSARTSRPHKARAVDMDESLNMTQQMRHTTEALSAKQQEAVRKSKEARSNLLALRSQVKDMESQLDKTKQARDADDSTVNDTKAKMEKLKTEHAVLHATHTWTKSSLDSALAAQDEYRKGYNSLRTAFKKAKEDLQKKEDELDSCKNSMLELEKLKASLAAKEDQYGEELQSTTATLKRFMDQQKKKSQAVLDRMIAGQGAALVTVCFQSWAKAVKEGQISKAGDAAVQAAQDQLKAFQAKKKDEARSILDKMSAASDSGLLSVIVQNWSQVLKDAQKEREEAQKLQDTLKNQKAEARKALERHLGSSSTGIMTSAFKDWATYVADTKKENELKAQAEAALKEYQKKKKGEASSVVERMTLKKGAALMSQVWMCWTLVAVHQKNGKAQELKLREELDKLAAEVEAMKAEIAQKEEDLEDVQEELAESRKKNTMLREEFKNIMDLQSTMDASMKEMDDD